jgi:hypothetical protein
MGQGDPVTIDLLGHAPRADDGTGIGDCRQVKSFDSHRDQR